MESSQKACQWIRILACLMVWVSLLPPLSRAQELSLESAGARGGFSSNNPTDDFGQAEAFVNWNLPWRWEWGADWRLQSKLDLSAGWLGGHGAEAAIGTVGPSLVLSHARFPLSLEGGLSPTLLSRHEVGSRDFGSLVQFTSHAGLNWDLGQHFRLGYRFQ